MLAHPVAHMMLVLRLAPPLLLIPSFSALMPVFPAFISLGSLISAPARARSRGGTVRGYDAARATLKGLR